MSPIIPFDPSVHQNTASAANALIGNTAVCPDGLFSSATLGWRHASGTSIIGCQKMIKAVGGFLVVCGINSRVYSPVLSNACIISGLEQIIFYEFLSARS